MAKSRKTDKEAEEERMQTEEEDDDLSDDEMINREIEVNFEARTPDDSDFHGIKRLLQQLFLKAHINLSELSELIIKQNFVSSVIKQEIDEEDGDDENDNDNDMDDEDFGMISVINLTEKKDVDCIHQIRLFLENHCKGAGSEGKRLFSILEDPTTRVGLILSERFMNIPPKIALPLYENLRTDMKKAVDKRMKFDFSHYLLISKIYRPKTDKKDRNSDENIIYANAEEEFFAEEAEIQFEYSVLGELDSGLTGGWSEDDREWKPSRIVILIPVRKLDIVIQKMSSEFS